jgi:hypothetical protein
MSRVVIARRPLNALFFLACTLCTSSRAEADRSETKTVKPSPMPQDTQHVVCVLKAVAGMEVPTSFGDKPIRDVKTWIATNAKDNREIEQETLDLTIQPKKTYESQTYQDSVETGRVEVTHLYPTSDGIHSHKDVYENKKGANAVGFRSDNKGHLALSGDGEQLNLDFGTGILFRVWNAREYQWTAYTEAYSCRPNAR